MTGLKAAHEARADDPGLADTAHLLYGMALLAEGGELAEPAKFVAVLSRRLEHPGLTPQWLVGRSPADAAQDVRRSAVEAA